VIGCENLAKPKIAAAIADFKRQLAERAGITREEIISNLTPLARSSKSRNSLRAPGVSKSCS